MHFVALSETDYNISLLKLQFKLNDKPKLFRDLHVKVVCPSVNQQRSDTF